MNNKEDLAISLVQNNFTTGDLTGNAEKILHAYNYSVKNGADLIICSELALCGYPIEDLALRDDFQKASYLMLKKIAKETKEAGLLLGTILTKENSCKPYNAAVLLQNGKIQEIYKKSDLPNYGVFDEKRIFSASANHSIINFNNIALGVLICEDLWNEKISSEMKSLGAKILISLNASPFEAKKEQKILSIAGSRAISTNLPLIYVNQVGGQDELVFAGSSFCMDNSGKLTSMQPKWEESVKITLWENKNKQLSYKNKENIEIKTNYYSDIYNALKTGLKNYIEKNNFKGVLIGFSGGIDSAITSCIAVDALGKEKVKIVMMPSKFTSEETLKDAIECSELLGLKAKTVDIEPMLKPYSDLLSEEFTYSGDDLSSENIQSRIRGNILMLLSNKSGFIVLSTGNKSEVATGYTTLYGDMCGGFNVLKDLYKTEVFELAKWRNEILYSIPTNIIEKAPTAELRANQKDEDNLPPYEILDKILYGLIEENLSIEEIYKKSSIEKNIIKNVSEMLKKSEYKRFQSAPGIKISSALFGRERRYPITNNYKEVNNNE